MRDTDKDFLKPIVYSMSLHKYKHDPCYVQCYDPCVDHKDTMNIHDGTPLVNEWRNVPSLERLRKEREIKMAEYRSYWLHMMNNENKRIE